MAGASVLPAEVLLSKRVQEMVLGGEEPQPPYVYAEEGVDDGSSAPPTVPIPIIDLSLLSSAEPVTVQEELSRIRSALSSWGCFQALGHGIPRDLLDGIRRAAREFFELPMEEKTTYAKRVGDFEGYGGDPPPAEGVPLDWSDRLFLEVYPEDIRNYKLWPKYPESFRELLEDYTKKMKTFTEMVSKAMAKSLDLQENCFLDQAGERAALRARFNYYSTCQWPNILGLKAHSDGSVFTVILQDDVAGLQILKDEQWFTVPTNISDALLVVMGDQMHIMTNGIYASPVHRVLANRDKDRISFAVFYYPEIDREIGPEEGLISEERPRIFQKVKGYGDVHWENYQQLKSALHLVKA